MKIFTSYFDRTEKPRMEGLVHIGIAGISPPGFDGLEYKRLAPKRFIYDNYVKSGDEETYSRDYFRHVLDKLKPGQVVKDIVLLCYEKPNQFCHRHLVAYWMKSELGIEIEEL